MLTGVGAILVWRFWPRPPGAVFDPNATPRTVAARGDLADDEKTTISIFNQTSPSAVYITTLAVQHDVFSLDLQQIPQGTGSGFIWDDKGHVATNFHVIQGADTARVTLADHSTWRARVVGAYPDTDLAVLAIDAPSSQLRPIPIGSSHDLQVGQKTFAIGNPFGLPDADHRRRQRPGTGNGVGRPAEDQGHDSDGRGDQPGQLRRAAADSAGRLIGVNTAIYSPSGAFAGIGFAIPVDLVNRIVPQLIRSGKVDPPRPGCADRSGPGRRQLGLNGVLVLEVRPDSPAAKAGLRPTRRSESNRIELGDVITAVDGKPVKTANNLVDVLDQHKVGDKVSLTIIRDGKEQQLEVTLDEVHSGQTG